MILTHSQGWDLLCWSSQSSPSQPLGEAGRGQDDQVGAEGKGAELESELGSAGVNPDAISFFSGMPEVLSDLEEAPSQDPLHSYVRH